MLKNLLKFHIHQPWPGAPKPLFTGVNWTSTPFSILSYRPAKPYYLFKYTLRGVGALNDGKRIWELKPGLAFLYKFPRDDCYFYYEKSEEPWKGVYLEFDAGDLDNALERLAENYGVVFSLSPESTLIRRLLDYHNQYKSGSVISIDGLSGARMIYALLAALGASEDAAPGRANLINAVCDYVNNHLDKPFTIDKMARKLAVSRGHLTRVFTEKMSITPYQYVANAKARKACQLLSENKHTNEEIAEMIGCVSSIQFYRFFKRVVGVTPGQYRNSPRQEEIVRSL